MTEAPARVLFLDIGGVLLTNGWDRQMRRRGAEVFGLDFDDMEDRHGLTWHAYELGKIGFDQYLDLAVFYKKRPFARESFKEYIFAQSKPYPHMIELVRALKVRYGLRVGALSNGVRDLTEYRIRTFGLREFMDFFVESCYVHMRKPDPEMYRLALDVAQVRPEEAVYVEDRALFVDVARGLGIPSVYHLSVEGTRDALAKLGLVLE